MFCARRMAHCAIADRTRSAIGSLRRALAVALRDKPSSGATRTLPPICAGGGVVAIGVLGHADQVALCTGSTAPAGGTAVRIVRSWRSHTGIRLNLVAITGAWSAGSASRNGYSRPAPGAGTSESPVGGAMGCGVHRPGCLGHAAGTRPAARRGACVTRFSRRHTAGAPRAGRPGSSPPSSRLAIRPGQAPCPGRCRGTAACPGREPPGR
jgi:hypothetical protein